MEVASIRFEETQPVNTRTGRALRAPRPTDKGKIVNKIAAIVASLALVGQAPPAVAQAGNAQHVQSLANIYALTDYALGANEGCDLFTWAHIARSHNCA